MNAAQMNTVEAIIAKHTNISDLTSRCRGSLGSQAGSRRYYSRSYMLLNLPLRNELHAAGFRTFIQTSRCDKYSMEVFPTI